MIKKFLVLLMALQLSSCSELESVLGTLAESSTSGGGLSTETIALGLKEALNKGTASGVNILGARDGFLKNQAVKILFPPQAQKIAGDLRKIGLGSLVDNMVEKLNRGAEDAVKGAKPIFINAIKKMTITDAMNILMGADNAATSYLKRTTSSELYKSFNPVIKNSLNRVGALKAWTDVVSRYNQIPFVQKMNPNLDDHVTKKTMDGLFLMIQKEEKNIRKDPVKRTTEILKRVFAKQDNK